MKGKKREGDRASEREEKEGERVGVWEEGRERE